MKEIGGFIGLELSKKKEFHSDAIKLNSGRNAFLYMLNAYKPTKIYLPFYICDSIVDVVKKERIEFEFYHVNIDLDAIIDLKRLRRKDYVLYINYFGVKTSYCSELSQRHKNIFVDNAQAFYSRPFDSVCTMYSPRKFFGVPDGAYLYSKTTLDQKLERDHSYTGCRHLLKRLDTDAQASYNLFKKHEGTFTKKPLKLMSRLTQRMLASIDYEKNKIVREQNFKILHEALSSFNRLPLPDTELNGPMVYPFLNKSRGLKKFLLDNKIYVPTYWKEVNYRVNKRSLENMLTNNLIALPIDQRYSHKDMLIMINIILNYPGISAS